MNKYLNLDGLTQFATSVKDYAAKKDHNHNDIYSQLNHTHPISDITDLQNQLDSKQPKGEYLTYSDIGVDTRPTFNQRVYWVNLNFGSESNYFIKFKNNYILYVDLHVDVTTTPPSEDSYVVGTYYDIHGITTITPMDKNMVMKYNLNLTVGADGYLTIVMEDAKATSGDIQGLYLIT